MPAAHYRKLFILLFACLFLYSSRADAQSSLDPAQLPSRTLFYFLWRGTPPPESRKKNALLSLWDDPEFAPVRSALFQSMTANSSKETPSTALSSEEAIEYSTLLDNAFLIGFMGEPKPHRSPAVATATASTPWNGVFLIYDRSGKEALLAKALLRSRAQGNEIPKLTPFLVAGIPALKSETKSGSAYWAETGKFAVSAKERSVFEEILTRVAGKSTDSFTLAQNTYYQEAIPTLGKGFIEAFLRVGDLREIIDTSAPSNAQVATILDAVKLNSLHSLAFHVSLEGARTRVQGSLLGDTSKGTLFDIFSEGQQNPPSFAFLTPETVYFQETELNLLGMYDTLNRILRAFAPNPQGGTDMLDALAKQRLGMPLQEALTIVTGEFGSLQTSPVLDPNKQTYFFGIHKKPEALKLLRTIFAERITSERNEDSVTYLKISLQANQSSAGVAQWHFYHLAVTPNIILGAAQSESLRAVLVAKPLATAATPFPNAPALLAIRAQYPDKIHAFNYSDFQKLDWPVLKQTFLEYLKTTSNNRPADAKATPLPQEPPAWLIWLNPQIIPRHLHTTSSASWKDAKGVHFDEWLE